MKSRDQLVLATLGVLAVAVAFWFLALSPKRDKAEALSAQVTAAEVRRDAAVTKAAGAEKAKANYVRDYATVTRVGKAVPPQADVASLVYQLEHAAGVAKVDFRKVAVDSAQATPSGAATTTSGIAPTPFSFTFEGSFFSLNRLLGQIEKFTRVKGTDVRVSGRLLTLDQVKLSAGRGGLPKIKAEITAKAYVAPIAAVHPRRATTPAPATATTPTTAPAAQVTP